jgi:K+-sensing histidine kinase KdpD
MKWIAHHRQHVIVALAVTAPLAVAAVLVPFRDNLTNAATALILVAVVVAIASTGSRSGGYLASLSSTLWFDFFFTHPYNSFDIHGRDPREITICLLVVGLAVTELAARGRHHQRVSQEETQYVAMVRELTDFAQSSSGTQLIQRAEPMLIDLLHLRACRFDRQIAELPMASILANGEVAHVGLAWPADAMGIPGPQAQIVAVWHGRTLGRFVITPTPGEPVGQERRSVAAVLATVVAAGLASDREST